MTPDQRLTITLAVLSMLGALLAVALRLLWRVSAEVQEIKDQLEAQQVRTEENTKATAENTRALGALTERMATMEGRWSRRSRW